MLTALCKMIPNSKAHSQKDLNSIYTLSTPASKGVENIDALLDPGGTTTTVPTSTQVEDSPKTGDCYKLPFRY